jgi:anionic cell wall polymer biosynthesis LytR-Cps2A-Psr (LCP) family protein
MKNTRPSIDGFIPRRSGSQLGDLHEKDKEVPIDRSLHTEETARQPIVGVARENKVIGRSDIDDSLREIDDPNEPSTRKSRRAQKKLDKNKRPKSKVKRIIFWFFILLLVAGLGAGGYLLFKAINASDSVFKGNVFDLVKHDPLKEDEYGRSNFLIVGTAEDDPGHQAAYLTDSIMVVSINQKTKDAYTFNIPRDLEVQYGMACLPGYSGKINSYFNCVNDQDTDEAEQERLTKTQAFIGEIVGMDIQYGVHVNYTVMRDVVNAIGGNITVNIESRDPRGQMDSNFDWKCGANFAKRKTVCPPSGHFIDYPNGPAVLDAEHALYLAQARGDIAPTYGFEQSNFDRERNQQKILVAIREKAMSAGTLTNIGSVTALIDALGSNLRTNVETKEIQTLASLAKDIPADKIMSIDLHKEGELIFNASAQPAAGKFVYDDLRVYLNKIITQEPYVKEAPHVTVLNGSGTAGMAQTEADKLEDKSFIIDVVGNAPDTADGSPYPAVTVYQIATDKPLTAAKLKSLYNVTLKTTTPPVSVVGDTDFLIIIGPAQ